MTFLQELKLRLSLPSPDFFQKLARFGVWCSGVGILLVSPLIPSELGVDINLPITIPAVVSKVGSYLVLAGFLINRISKLTVADSTPLK